MGFGASYSGGGGVKNTYPFSITLSANTTGSYTLPASVDTTQSRIILATPGLAGGNTDARYSAFRVRLVNATTVDAIRSVAVGPNTTIKGFVEEFNKGAMKSLQRGTIECSAAVSSQTLTVTSFNTNKYTLTHLGCSLTGSPGSVDGRDVPTIQANSATQIQATKQENWNVGSGAIVSYELIEWS